MKLFRYSVSYVKDDGVFATHAGYVFAEDRDIAISKVACEYDISSIKDIYVEERLVIEDE